MGAHNYAPAEIDFIYQEKRRADGEKTPMYRHADNPSLSK